MPIFNNREVVTASAPLTDRCLCGISTVDDITASSNRNPTGRATAPYVVSSYINDGATKNYLDARRFACLNNDGEAVYINDTYGRRDKSGVFSWGARWKYAGNRGALSLTSRGNVDMLVIRCFEEESYQSRLYDIVERYRYEEQTSVADLALSAFEWPYDHLCLISAREHWARDIDLEFRFRNGVSKLRVFAGWHNQEFFEMKNIFRRQYYANVPEWWPNYEPSRFLVCPSPSVFAYRSQDFINGSEVERRLVANIAVSEFAVIATMCGFLRAARHGVDFVSRAFDPRLKRVQNAGLGIITLIPDDLVDTIERMKIFHIVRASDYDAALSFIALRRSTSV